MYPMYRTLPRFPPPRAGFASAKHAASLDRTYRVSSQEQKAFIRKNVNVTNHLICCFRYRRRAVGRSRKARNRHPSNDDEKQEKGEGKEDTGEEDAAAGQKRPRKARGYFVPR